MLMSKSDMVEFTRIPPARQTVIMPDGTFARTWYLFFESLYQRTGGSAPASATEDVLPPGGSSSVVDMGVFQSEFGQSPVWLPPIQQDSSGLEGRVLGLEQMLFPQPPVDAPSTSYEARIAALEVSTEVEPPYDADPLNIGGRVMILEQETRVFPPVVPYDRMDSLQAELNECQARLAEIMKEVDALKQGVII